jgi:hypothetical protein
MVAMRFLLKYYITLFWWFNGIFNSSDLKMLIPYLNQRPKPWLFSRRLRLGHKAFVRGSAGAKLTLNQDFKHEKEDFVSENTLMLFTKLNLLNQCWPMIIDGGDLKNKPRQSTHHNKNLFRPLRASRCDFKKNCSTSFA